MRKKVLFLCYGLGVGGIEVCFINLLNQLADEDMDIDVLLMNPIYDLKDRVLAKNVYFIPEFEYVLNTTDVMSYIHEHGGTFHNIGLFLRYLLYRFAVKVNFKKPWLLYRALPTYYDVAIVYSKNGKAPYYAIDKIKAKKKVLWNHEGVYEQPRKRYMLDKEYYPRYDTIVSVSTDAKNNLCEYFPVREKSIVLRNVADVKLIKEKSNEFVPVTYTEGFFHIVTVGRLVEQKKPDWAISVCENLVKEGYKIKWHWIGNGNLDAVTRQLITEKNLSDTFILEGNKLNPYPYISNADLYVQSSRHEAYCTTITEAKILCTPIVTTDVGGMKEQIENGINGIIADASVESLTESIIFLLENPKIKENIIVSLQNEKYETYIQPYMDYIFN